MKTYIVHILNKEIISSFPHHYKHNGVYGYLVLLHDYTVIFCYSLNEDVVALDDVSKDFTVYGKVY